MTYNKVKTTDTKVGDYDQIRSDSISFWIRGSCRLIIPLVGLRVVIFFKNLCLTFRLTQLNVLSDRTNFSSDKINVYYFV